MDTETFYSRLKRLRQAKNLSRKQMAALLGVSSYTYREWEYGRAIRDGQIYLKIAQVFEVSVGELLGDKAQSRTDMIKKVDSILLQLTQLRKDLFEWCEISPKK